MVIYLSGEVAPEANLDIMTPRQIVAELDKYVVGQNAAKRAVAIALRNRIRRQKLPQDLAQDVMPKNIIMIGSTGVGKTEIARRLARLAGSPFIKVEASKFTEVGYVGRDVESIIRDLVEIAIDLVREKKIEEIADKAQFNAEERILDILLPNSKLSDSDGDESTSSLEQFQRTREKLRQQLRDGRLASRMVDIEVRDRALPNGIEIITPQGVEEMDINLKDILPNIFPSGRTKKRKLRVDEAIEYLMAEEEQKLIDMEQVSRLALEKVESSGIVFVDEIDKIAGHQGGAHGPDISREGVQRDLLPIIEGTTVNTRYGMVRTDHILFIAAGAFHVSKPSDLIPELQGRFPIRVNLDPLTKEDFKRILTEPKNSLIRQYTALMETEGIQLEFMLEAIETLADYAYSVNKSTEDIGARRLHTVMERLLDEISFEGSDLVEKHQTIDTAYVYKMLANIVQNDDLSRYIL